MPKKPAKPSSKKASNRAVGVRATAKRNPDVRPPTRGVTPERSTQSIVMECVKAAAPDGATFDKHTVLSSILVRGDDLVVCLNREIPLAGGSRWVSGQIKSSWTIDTVIARTEYRRDHP